MPKVSAQHACNPPNQLGEHVEGEGGQGHGLFIPDRCLLHSVLSICMACHGRQRANTICTGFAPRTLVLQKCSKSDLASFGPVQ